MSGPKTFASLRGRPAAPARAEEEPIELVFRRHMIASADGQRLLAWMRAEVEDATPINCSEAALRDAEGARRFVQKMLRMATASA